MNADENGCTARSQAASQQDTSTQSAQKKVARKTKGEANSRMDTCDIYFVTDESGKGSGTDGRGFHG
jgi:hypothetical protein